MAMPTFVPPHPAPEATLPEYALRVTGAVRMVLVINLSSFVTPETADDFRHLRGSEAFAEALRGLRPQAPFGRDEATDAIERDGYALRIFRSRLVYNHFFPTYRFGWDNTMRARLEEMGCADVARWQRWASRVRLTRNGLAVITLEQPIEDLPLIKCTEQILELPAQGAPSPGQDQWSIGMTILRALLDAIDCRIVLHVHGHEREIRFMTTAHFKHTLRLDRYVIYTFRRIARDGQLLTPDDLKRDYTQILASFMEGALVECEGVRRYPIYSADRAHALLASDVASWDEELCLFTGESALIYYPLVGRGIAYIGGPLGLDAHAYSAYWAGIARGAEHLLAFRSEAQQAERRTTDLLSRVPSLTRKVNDGALVAEDLALIDHLAAGLSDIFDGLPEMRSMAVSTNAFRADYARRKFEVLLRELAVRETLELVNTNVEQLDFFLSYYNDMRLQWQAQHTNSLGVILATIVLFMAVSSFLADTFNVADRLVPQNDRDRAIQTFGAEIVIAAVGLLILGLMIWQARKLLNRRWRK
ncbi:MAG: hypothetical protein ACJ8CR_19170 [Roseiflexaceae bacterium]